MGEVDSYEGEGQNARALKRHALSSEDGGRGKNGKKGKNGKRKRGGERTGSGRKAGDGGRTWGWMLGEE